MNQTERHSWQIKFNMTTRLRSHDNVPHCSDVSTRGLLRDVQSNVQKVLDAGMEGEVGEGRKKGNGNHLMVSDIYNHQIRPGKRISTERRNVQVIVKQVSGWKKFVFGWWWMVPCWESHLGADSCQFCPPPSIFAAQCGVVQSQFSLGLNPYPFPRPLWEDKRDIDKESFICVYQAVYHLLFSMPVFYTAHDDCMEELKKALLQIFPDNEIFQWCANVPANQGIPEGTPVRYKGDLVYQCKKTLVPLIFIEVKLELGEGGNPFWQNHHLYQSYIKENMQARCRAPVFFVQLCGMAFLLYDFYNLNFFTPRYTSWDRWGLLWCNQQ